MKTVRDFGYVERFKTLGVGMFVHFGLYSVAGKGEWYKYQYKVTDVEYQKLMSKFKVHKNWAKELVKVAKSMGAKYINIGTRHHDGFSLYDTKGLNEYDSIHTPTGRDLIREFVEECNKEGIVPFFYHTLLDWYNPDYNDNFPSYIDYLVKSIEILCTSYGKIGGIWFDGMWDKPNADWQEDRIYATIRKYQPEAMIINNTGLIQLGKIGHFELDGVTFERGKTFSVDNSDRPRAGEMCQVLNDNWGYAKDDCNYKSVKEILENLVDCRVCGCNFLLNVAPKLSGIIKNFDKEFVGEVGKWIKTNKNFIYEAKPVTDVTADGADILFDGKYYYAIIKDMTMAGDPHVALYAEGEKGCIKINSEKRATKAEWLDSGKRVKIRNNSFIAEAFPYGVNHIIRVLRFELI